MKKITQYIIPIFFIIFLINPASGFPPGMNLNSSTAKPDVANITDSDQDILLIQHLIELDAVQLKSENKLIVRENLVFYNKGALNFSGSMRTWVPDGTEGIRIGKIEMMTGALHMPLQHVQKGNIISWQDFIEKNTPLPSLYALEYVVAAEPEGTITKTKQYSKVFLYPTLTKQPGNIVLKVTRSRGESIAINDEKGNSISASGNPREEGSDVFYTWENPGFKEIDIKISESAISPAAVAGYVSIGVLILLVFLYPILRKKSEKLQSIEDKIRDSLKRETRVEEHDAEFLGKTKDELENQKNELLSRLSELDKEYTSGNMLDEEYEEHRKSYHEKVEKINKRIEQL